MRATTNTSLIQKAKELKGNLEGVFNHVNYLTLPSQVQSELEEAHVQIEETIRILEDMAGMLGGN